MLPWMGFGLRPRLSIWGGDARRAGGAAPLRGENRAHLFEVDVGLRRLLLRLEGVAPRKAELDVLLVAADGKAHLHGAQRTEVPAQWVRRCCTRSPTAVPTTNLPTFTAKILRRGERSFLFVWHTAVKLQRLVATQLGRWMDAVHA